MNTMTNYDSIDKALNTSSAIDVTPTSKPQKVESTKDDVKKDYDYTRANLYSLVEKGQEALNGILEVAVTSNRVLVLDRFVLNTVVLSSS